MKTFLPEKLTATQMVVICCNIALLVYLLLPTKIIEKTTSVTIQDLHIDSAEQSVVVEMGIFPTKTSKSTAKHGSKKLPQKTIPITKVITDRNVLNFICKDRFLERAFKVQKETGLLVSTIIAQKGIESNWGKSGLTQKTKNLSNIKCTNKKCKKNNVKLRKKGQMGSKSKHCIQLYDDNPNDRFLRLETNWQGWNKYKELLQGRYHKVKTYNTVRGQATELKRKGWATARNYVSILDNTAKKMNLNTLQNYIDQGYTITTENGKYILLQQ